MGAHIQSVEFSEEQKILKINMNKSGENFGVILLWKTTKLYFCHYFYEEDNLKIRKWWEKLRVDSCESLSIDNILTNIFKLKQSEKLVLDLTPFIFDVIEYEKEKDKMLISKKASNKNELKRTKILGDLENIRKWIDIENYLNRNKNKIIGQKAIEIVGVKFKTNDMKTDYALLDKIYEKIKSLKRAEVIQVKRLSETAELKINDRKKELSFYSPFVEKIIKPREIKKVSEDRPLEIEIYKFGNASIAIGLSAQGNDWIRNKWASEDDIWFHLESGSSSHVVLKYVDKNSSVLEYTDLVASLIYLKMNLKYEMISMIYTKVKNLKSVKGKPGLVRYTEQRKIFGTNRPELIKMLIRC
jgi:predicted ribosome quality control (RQC) complex YloA/Tae2 family protein